VLVGSEMSMVVADCAVVPFFDVYAVGGLLCKASEPELLVNEE
jgi:hypothetical protein